MASLQLKTICLSQAYHEFMLKSPFTKRETVDTFVTVSQFSLWTGGRAAEGTGLLNRRTGYTGTAGSTKLRLESPLTRLLLQGCTQLLTLLLIHVL